MISDFVFFMGFVDVYMSMSVYIHFTYPFSFLLVCFVSLLFVFSMCLFFLKGRERKEKGMGLEVGEGGGGMRTSHCKNTFIHLFICVAVGVGGLQWLMLEVRGQLAGGVSLMWVLGIKCRSTGFLARAFTL